MANPQHLRLLIESPPAWNEWRERNPEIQPDLGGADLHEMDLRWKDFSNADLRKADLTGAGLRGANFWRADLRDANLQRSNLRRANLSGADLSYANFIEANVCEANLGQANFNYTDLSKAFLFKAGICWALFFRANLSGANLRRADLRGVTLAEAKLKGAALEGTLLEGVVFDPAHLQEVGLDETELEDARRGKVFAVAEIHLPRDVIPLENLAKLEAAVREFMAACTFDFRNKWQLVHGLYGSLYEGLKFWSKKKLTSDELDNIFRTGREALCERALDKPGPERLDEFAGASQQICECLAPYQNVALRLGEILLVKTTQEQQIHLQVETISPELALMFEKFPRLLQDPQTASQLLKDSAQIEKALPDRERGGEDV